MFKTDAQEAATICEAVLVTLLAQTPASGALGANLRTAINSFRVNAVSLLMADAAGPPLQQIFQLAQQNGIPLPQMDYVRTVTVAQSPTLPGAVLIWNALIEFAFATEALIIASTTFVSRSDVEATRATVKAAFEPMEEAVADANDNVGYLALVSVHAAISYHLTVTAEPLPEIVTYTFSAIEPSLALAYKLYTDASRADQLVAENKVVHPAFMPLCGRALSA
jgi:prophage DNA circulation protein